MLVLIVIAWQFPQAVSASDDWPMWRSDAQRSAASTNKIADSLQPLWQREFSQRQPAWDDPLNLDLMTYDRIFEPIVLDGRMFVGFNDRDKLMALDAGTGRELWSFFTEAPVRLPPVGWQNRIYFCSDDGFLYCVNAEDGTLEWKFSGAPNSQHVIGNQRLTSAWPARGGPVVRDGQVYFAASIWPFMGTFIYALDAESGEIEWLNDSTGAHYIKQPHSAPSFAGVAPQGALVATENELIVPGGRSVPAVFDRATGSLRYFELNAGGKGSGGSFVAAADDFFYVHTREKGTRAFNITTGLKTAFMPNEPVLAAGTIYSAELVEERPVIRAYGTDEQLKWEIEADGTGDLILAGNKLIAAGGGNITAVRLPTDDKPAEIVFQLPCAERIERLLVASGKLFAVTLDGKLLAFGDSTAADENSKSEPSELANRDPQTGWDISAADQRAVKEMLGSSPAEGFAFWFGSTDSGVARCLATQSPFEQLAMVDSDASRVERMRREMDAARIEGVTQHLSAAAAFRAPQYVGNMLFIAPELAASIDGATLASLYQSVRPYGGTMHVLVSRDKGDQAKAARDAEQLAAQIEALQLEQAQVEVRDYGVCVRRVGALPGSSDWTHQYGDVANTLKSNDSRVKLPLGVLWFGGSSNMDVLPRHGHGPPEQVVGGRLYIQGMSSLNCRDVYTGRVIWKRDFEDLGTFDVYFDTTYEDTPLDTKYNQVHIPGANARGTNYVVTEDRVYILVGNTCLALDPLSGETLHEIELPRDANGEQPEWGYIGVYEDVLIGGLGFAKYRERHGLEFESDKGLSVTKAGFGSKSFDRAASVGLIGFDRHTGKQLWQVMAQHSFLHNGIVAGKGKLYCLDKNPRHIEEALLRRGKPAPDDYRIVAMDIKTGQTTWEVKHDIFGTWLGYSPQFDLLLQAGSQASDRLASESGHGMAVYHAGDGSVLWQNEDLAYSGPCILHNDLIITNANSYSESAGAFYLKTGKQKLVKNPLTGEIQPWKITRAYGCNTIIASENLLTFRSGAAGFYDLLTEGGTGNLGGFKSGCTSNLVVANGVLNAPDYTRTCTCSYQNQTSLALVHMPEIDMWTNDLTSAQASPDQLIERLAINFGAPGDRRQADGQLWMEYPVVAGDSAPIEVTTNAEAKPFQHHSSLVTGVERPWVSASGLEDLTELQIGLRLVTPPAPPEDAADNGAKNKSDKVADTNEGATSAAVESPKLVSEEPTSKELVPEHRYDVRLHFACSPLTTKGRRVFDVYVQDELKLSDVTLDPSGTSGQATAEHLLEGVSIAGKLQLRFVAKEGTPALAGIEVEKLP
ncbi:MAG: PQQ-binding-like beta-propeller repeat protein [Pirellulaceae bacterium]|jgi:outer membrane protein assembly factor BamB|nr:PQQ-binding-like beta-propeller repeat protein [Pirellulaceae bacterium]